MHCPSPEGPSAPLHHTKLALLPTPPPSVGPMLQDLDCCKGELGPEAPVSFQPASASGYQESLLLSDWEINLSDQPNSQGGSCPLFL